MTVAKVRANGIELAYETFGDPNDPPVVLVMGLGVQMIGWDDEFCRLLTDAGHFVVRFDNRDVGESTHFSDAPPPNLLAALTGNTSSAVYDLDDMADDTVGLLDALGIESAHLVGVSGGGMIVQTVAIRHPDRVRSLTSIMSTTGERAVTSSTQEAQAVLLQAPARSAEEFAELQVKAWRVIGSPGFAFDEQLVRDRARRSYVRSYDPMGIGRQLVAIYASGDRTARLREIDVPTVVIHGTDDPLIQVPAGRATARAIPGAEYVEFQGMGHDLPRELWPRIVEAIGRAIARGEGEPAAA